MGQERKEGVFGRKGGKEGEAEREVKGVSGEREEEGGGDLEVCW